jgi:hypothetical protein
VPHVRGHRRRRSALRPASTSTGSRARHRPRRGSRAPDHVGVGRHRGAAAHHVGVMHGPRGERRAVLRDVVRGRRGVARGGRRAGRPARPRRPASGERVDGRRAGDPARRRPRRGGPGRAVAPDRLPGPPAAAVVGAVGGVQDPGAGGHGPAVPLAGGQPAAGPVRRGGTRRLPPGQRAACPRRRGPGGAGLGAVHAGRPDGRRVVPAAVLDPARGPSRAPYPVADGGRRVPQPGGDGPALRRPLRPGPGRPGLLDGVQRLAVGRHRRGRVPALPRGEHGRRAGGPGPVRVGVEAAARAGLEEAGLA